MTKFGHQPMLAVREGHKLGPATYQIAVPRIAAQLLTPRERGGPGGGSLSVASSMQGTPRDRASVASYHSHGQRKPTDKERKWQLRGWQVDDRPEKPEDGIVGWAKRRTALENKKGSKRGPSITENEHYFPVKSHCSATDDLELFRQETLHSRFLPKVKQHCQLQRPSNVTFKYSKSEDRSTTGAPGKLALLEAGEEEQVVADPAVQRQMQSYRDAKQMAAALGQEILLRRSKSLTDLTMHYNSQQHNKIKRWLKFSKDRKSCRFDEDEDEGYSSKTSSAETKPRSDSDGEEGELTLVKNSRLSSSMIDLSELPSNFTRAGRGQDKATADETVTTAENTRDAEPGKVKFSYTHQPTILQIPHPDLKLIREHARTERAASSEEVPFSYSRLKRAKEINKCYKIDPKKFSSENTVYDVSATGRGRAESPRGVTLVLRKISIQNADQQVTSVMNTSTPPLIATADTSQPARSNSSADSATSRAGSSTSRAGSSKSRSTSAKSRANSANSRCSITPQMEFKNRMQNKQMHQNSARDSTVDSVSRSLREPTWCPEYSVLGRPAATSYSIGDLLPAVDKSIYTQQQCVRGRLGARQHGKRYQGMAPLLREHDRAAAEETSAAKDDGYLLLQKGMDLLTGDTEMPILGPPAFRPPPAHQFVRNVRFSVRHGDAPRSSPIYGKGSYSPMGFHSDRGPRIMQSPEKETQRKLKEAFTKFYQNRPKEVGKEFRRMHTMWNA